VDLASIFLGPKGENADVFERLLLERSATTSSGGATSTRKTASSSETEKQAPEYERSLSTLSEELMGLLGELKAGVPFFSPRYIGHMSSDLTMASLIGYFATMLYNPNNVAAEASPVTTRMELEVADQLARMIGYDPAKQWGHLTSGGTVANFEALWVARNVKYLPVAVRWAAEEAGVGGLPVGTPVGGRASLDDMELWGLLNVAPLDAMDLADAFRARLGDDGAAVEALAQHSLAGLGYQEFGRRLSRQFGDALQDGAVLVPSTAHYSWEKICRALGIGGRQLIHVPVDRRFRMDPAALEATVHALADRRQPIIACISVIGTTEESAVDRLDLIADVRDRVARELGVAFHLHADAAWGGYAASTTRGPDGRRRSYEDALADYAPEAWPEEGVYRGLCAMERTDTVTIDPHKLGFIPYPAGAVSFRDLRVRELVAVEAPYLFHRGASEWGYIGRFIFEGSKPGAAAAGVWMSHKVLPLDSSGYGRLIGETARGALLLHRRLASGDWGPFTLFPLPLPDLNIVCFAIGHPSLTTLEATNDFAGRVYGAMSVSEERSARQLDYFVTKTVLRAREYGHAADPDPGGARLHPRRLPPRRRRGCDPLHRHGPVLAARRGKMDFIGGFAKTLRSVLEAAL
jgi:glutamate/tyrosine decarboxylase-like PLP-dependent enzyme